MILSLISRRRFLQSIAAASAGVLSKRGRSPALTLPTSSAPRVLEEFGYADVSLDSPIHEEQLRQTHAVLMGLDDDALMKPFRMMVDQPAPGEDLGGWYRYDANYDWHTFDAGFAPTATFGQWISALSRAYAITGSQAAVNHLGITATTKLTDFSGYWILLVSAALTAGLLAFAPDQP